tara:strand:+ start:311 stop:520 length:210 start_codon:yes stop_codon:yes gene_type:complete
MIFNLDIILSLLEFFSEKKCMLEVINVDKMIEDNIRNFVSESKRISWYFNIIGKDEINIAVTGVGKPTK